jgi:hypothetical protein
MRRALIGAAVLAAYVAVALAIPGAPSRPLFDIQGPPEPYRWVDPPPEFAQGNKSPEGTAHDLALGASGSEAASIATADGQAAVVLKEKTFAPRSGEKFVVIRIDPLDPAPIGPPPSGLRYDGNAYRFVAAYKRSGEEAALTQAATIVLQFPLVSTHLYRRDGAVWTDLKANPVSVSLQIFANSDRFGTFVAAGPPIKDSRPKKGFPTAIVISVGSGVAAVVAGLVTRMRGRTRRRARARSKPASKRAPPRSQER